MAAANLKPVVSPVIPETLFNPIPKGHARTHLERRAARGDIDDFETALLHLVKR
jgi:hypothetical protein